MRPQNSTAQTKRSIIHPNKSFGDYATAYRQVTENAKWQAESTCSPQRLLVAVRLTSFYLPARRATSKDTGSLRTALLQLSFTLVQSALWQDPAVAQGSSAMAPTGN